MKRFSPLAAVLVGLMVLAATAADLRSPSLESQRKADPVAIQIKAGQTFSVPLTDGTTAPARAENIDGKARLTIIAGGQFLDLQLLAWGTGPTPNPPIPPTPPGPPVPPTPPTPPVPPVSIPAALVVITESPTASGSWTSQTITAVLARGGITTYNYAISSVSDASYSDLTGLRWIGKSAGKATPYAFLVDASGKVLWEGAAPTTDAGWIEALGKYARRVGQ